MCGTMTLQKHVVFCMQTAANSKVKSMSHISDPRPKKKAEVHSKTRKKVKVWRLVKKYMEQGINLNASDVCWQMGEYLTIQSKTCLGVHSKIVQEL